MSCRTFSSDPLHPFNNPEEGSRAFAFTPDVMEDEEEKEFPQLCRLSKNDHSNIVVSW